MPGNFPLSRCVVSGEGMVRVAGSGTFNVFATVDEIPSGSATNGEAVASPVPPITFDVSHPGSLLGPDAGAASGVGSVVRYIRPAAGDPSNVMEHRVNEYTVNLPPPHKSDTGPAEWISVNGKTGVRVVGSDFFQMPAFDAMVGAVTPAESATLYLAVSNLLWAPGNPDGWERLAKIGMFHLDVTGGTSPTRPLTMFMDWDSIPIGMTAEQCTNNTFVLALRLRRHGEGATFSFIHNGPGDRAISSTVKEDSGARIDVVESLGTVMSIKNDLGANGIFHELRYYTEALGDDQFNAVHEELRTKWNVTF